MQRLTIRHRHRRARRESVILGGATLVSASNTRQAVTLSAVRHR